MRLLVLAYVAAGTVGAVHTVRRRRSARFAGVPVPGTPLQHALTIGTPLSAPPFVWLALLLAEGRGRDDMVRKLSILFVIGILGEPDTWTTACHPATDPLATALVGLDLSLPVLMLRGRPRPAWNGVKQ